MSASSKLLRQINKNVQGCCWTHMMNDWHFMHTSVLYASRFCYSSPWICWTLHSFEFRQLWRESTRSCSLTAWHQKYTHTQTSPLLQKFCFDIKESASRQQHFSRVSMCVLSTKTGSSVRIYSERSADIEFWVYPRKINADGDEAGLIGFQSSFGVKIEWASFLRFRPLYLDCER